MLTNFEKITTELREFEIEFILPDVIEVLKNQKKPITSKKLLENINQGKNYTLNDVRFRKMVNYIRSNSILPIISTHRGYFVSYDEKELSDQIKSLYQRSNSIQDSAFGLNKILKENVQGYLK